MCKLEALSDGRDLRPSVMWRSRQIGGAMNVRADQLGKQVSRARARGWTRLMGKAENRHNLPTGLLLAVASRETDMEDVVGDKGHGRGRFRSTIGLTPTGSRPTAPSARA
jgi:hypothetical protein